MDDNVNLLRSSTPVQTLNKRSLQSPQKPQQVIKKKKANSVNNSSNSSCESQNVNSDNEKDLDSEEDDSILAINCIMDDVEGIYLIHKDGTIDDRESSVFIEQKPYLFKFKSGKVIFLLN